MKADVLIVTVTKPEGQAVFQVFQEATKQVPIPEPIGDKTYHDLGTVNDARIYMVQSEMGTTGLGAALQTVQKGIAALQPDAVVMVGIAFGIDATKQSIGDVLVSKQLLLYELQRVGTNKQGVVTIISRGDKPSASPWLLDRCRSAELYWNASLPKIRTGLLLSGEKLVDNLDFREELRGFAPEAIGGEMEGGGLYVACQDAKTDWIIVKAISDWADSLKDHNKDEHQRVAASNAASFVLHVLRHAPLRRGERRGVVRIADVQFTKPSAAPMGLQLQFHLTVANEGTTPVTVKSFEFALKDAKLGAGVVRWAQGDPASTLGGQHIEGDFVRVAHVFPRGMQWREQTLPKALFNPLVPLQPGEVIGPFQLLLFLQWGAEGEDPGYGFERPGERHTAVVNEITAGHYSLRARLHDGSLSYYTDCRLS